MSHSEDWLTAKLVAVAERGGATWGCFTEMGRVAFFSGRALHLMKPELPMYKMLDKAVISGPPRNRRNIKCSARRLYPEPPKYQMLGDTADKI